MKSGNIILLNQSQLCRVNGGRCGCRCRMTDELLHILHKTASQSIVELGFVAHEEACQVLCLKKDLLFISCISN